MFSASRKSHCSNLIAFWQIGHRLLQHRSGEMSLAHHASPVFILTINIQTDASWQHVPYTHHSKQAFPQLLQRLNVSVKMQMFDHTCQLSILYTVLPPVPAHAAIPSSPAVRADMGNPGDWDELCVSPRSLLSPEKPRCLPIFSPSLSLLSTWECAGSRQATETRKTFPLWQI